MTTYAEDYFNSKSSLRPLASRVALRARRRMYERFVSLVGTEPGRRLLDLGVTPDTSLPDSNFLEQWYPHRADITMASTEDCSLLETVFPGTTFVRIKPDVAMPFPDARQGFANIAYLKLTLFLLYTATVIGSLGMSIFHAHFAKRA